MNALPKPPSLNIKIVSAEKLEQLKKSEYSELKDKVGAPHARYILETQGFVVDQNYKTA